MSTTTASPYPVRSPLLSRQPRTPRPNRGYGAGRGRTDRGRARRAGRRRTNGARASFGASLGMALARNPLAVTALLAILTALFAWAYWQSEGLNISLNGGLNPVAGDGVSGMVRKAATDDYVNSHFVMGGVKLGMTRAMVERRHPNAQHTTDRAGQPVLTVNTDRGMLVAWLYTHEEVVQVDGKPVLDPVQRVHRLRLDEVHPQGSEVQILAPYAREYGRPIGTDCARATPGDTPRCTYYWWGGEGIELQATLKKKADPNGRDYTLLTTIATDTARGKKASVTSLSALSGSLRWGM